MSTLAVSIFTSSFCNCASWRAVFDRRPLVEGQIRSALYARTMGRGPSIPRRISSNRRRVKARRRIGAGPLRVHDSISDRIAHQAGRLVEIQLLHETRPMRLDRLRGDAEELGHRARGLSLGDELQDLALAGRERVWRGVVLAERGGHDAGGD